MLDPGSAGTGTPNWAKGDKPQCPRFRPQPPVCLSGDWGGWAWTYVGGNRTTLSEGRLGALVYAGGQWSMPQCGGRPVVGSPVVGGALAGGVPTVEACQVLSLC